MDKSSKIISIISLIVSVITLVVLVTAFPKSKTGLLGIAGSISTFYDVNVDSSNGIGTGAYYINGTAVIASSTTGAAITAQTLSVGSGGTISGINTTTTSAYNPASVPIGAATFTEIAVPSTFSQGKPCFAGLSAATSTSGAIYQITCVMGTSTVQLGVWNSASSTAAVDIATSTPTIWQIE